MSKRGWRRGGQQERRKNRGKEMHIKSLRQQTRKQADVARAGGSICAWQRRLACAAVHADNRSRQLNVVRAESLQIFSQSCLLGKLRWTIQLSTQGGGKDGGAKCNVHKIERIFRRKYYVYNMIKNMNRLCSVSASQYLDVLMHIFMFQQSFLHRVFCTWLEASCL